MTLWLYDEKPIDTEKIVDFIGFVYIITNETNGRQYIGKKLLKFKKTKIIKGKKKKFLHDSNWQTYWGSNDELKNDIKMLPKLLNVSVKYICDKCSKERKKAYANIHNISAKDCED